jgi:hypothetical protein
VRGNPDYGINHFKDNHDGTITDEATGLTWMKADSGKGMDWPSALVYGSNLELAGYTDWRLPSAKELQTIIDYTRSPDTTKAAAIDPFFQCSEITTKLDKKILLSTGPAAHMSARTARIRPPISPSAGRLVL